MTLSLSKIIEGLLFYFGDAVSLTDLEKYTEKTSVEIQNALVELEQNLVDRGIVLVRQNNKVTLATHPNISNIITALQKEELEGELSKAAQEVLSIVLYAGPISKGYIDYIRGVNSTVSVRNLVARGLIEKKDGSSRPQYTATSELLMSLGVTSTESIDGYQDMRQKLESVLQVSKKE